MASILIVEDEADIALSLEEDLRRQGHQSEIAPDGRVALERGRSAKWDLILLDVMLPHMDGFDVCAELRRSGVTTPIIMLTARTQEAEKILGLDAGADDYVTKPFSLRELRARIRAQLRRASAPAAQLVSFGDCDVDFDRGELRRAGRRVDLTAQEFRLLSAFVQNRGRLLTRNQLIDAAWGHGISVTDRAVDTHVFNLRRKIEPIPGEPRFIVGVRGLGYRFDDEPLSDS